MELKVELENPYKLRGSLPYWLRIYTLYPETPRKNVFRAIFRFLYHLARVYGFFRIKTGNHKLFPIYFDGSTKIRARDTNSQFSSVYLKEYFQVYEPDVSSVLQYFLREGDVLADIGANWGHHSFQVIKRKNVNVLAFEANPLVVEDINRIACDLNVEDKIQVFGCALSEKRGTTELIQSYFESGLASIEQSVFEKRKKGTISKLHQLFKLLPIKQFVATRSFDSFNFKKLNFMKIDAEGAEIGILKGSRDSINEFKPYICFEYHAFHVGDLQGLNQFSNFFDDLGYVMYQINVEKNKSSNFVNRVFLKKLKINNLKEGTHHNILAIHSSKTPPSLSLG